MDEFKAYIRGILPANRFARGVSVLLGGTAGAQILSVLATPVLARVYQPASFGLLAVFVALMSIGGVVSGLRYHAAIPLPKSDRDADALFMLSLLLVLATALLTALPALLLPERIAAVLNAPALSGYLYLLPIGIFFLGIAQSSSVLAIRYQTFSVLATAKIAQSLATLGIQLIGAQLGALGLLIGQVAGQATGSLSLMYGTQRGLRRWLQVDTSLIRDMASRYRHFALMGTWTAVFSALSAQLPSILFAILFGPAAAGIYVLAYRALAAPMQLLGQATSQVFYSGAVEANRECRLGTLTAMVHSRLTHIAMPPTLALLISGPEIFTIVFGQAWQESGVFAQWLAPCLFLDLITTPLAAIFSVLERLGTRLMFESALFIVRLAAFLVGAYIGDAAAAIAFLAGGTILCQVILLIYLMRITGNEWSAAWRATLNAMLWSLLLVSPLILSKFGEFDRALWLVAIAAAALLITARYSFLAREAWTT